MTTKSKAKETPTQRTARLSKLAEDIAARGGHMDGQGRLVMPLGGKQTLTGFDGKPLKTTLTESMKSVIDYLLDKREALENVKNAVDDAVEEVKEQMKTENLTTVTALDKHSKKFIITLKPGKTKLEVKAAK